MILTKFINFIFFLYMENKIIIKKIKINSPLVKINNPEAIEKRIVFLKVSALSSFNNKLRNNSDSNICSESRVVSFNL